MISYMGNHTWKLTAHVGDAPRRLTMPGNCDSTVQYSARARAFKPI
jgi:hypothetical protein